LAISEASKSFVKQMIDREVVVFYRGLDNDKWLISNNKLKMEDLKKNFP
jgi:hypothetical protein